MARKADVDCQEESVGIFERFVQTCMMLSFFAFAAQCNEEMQLKRARSDLFL